jgi:hypothetical protein
MQVSNKTFDEIGAGDTASLQRMWQPGNLRAWTNAFGGADVPNGGIDENDSAGIITAVLTSLAGSTLPGPGATVRSASVRVRRALPVNTLLTAQLVVREKRRQKS